MIQVTRLVCTQERGYTNLPLPSRSSVPNTWSAVDSSLDMKSNGSMPSKHPIEIPTTLAASIVHLLIGIDICLIVMLCGGIPTLVARACDKKRLGSTRVCVVSTETFSGTRRSKEAAWQ